MIDKLKRKLLKQAFSSLSAFLLYTQFLARPALAQGCELTTTISGKEVPQLGGLVCVLASLLKTGMDLALGVGMIMLIISGVKYATATADPKALEGAKRTMTYTILGLVLALGARSILILISNLLGAENLDFWQNIILPG